MKEQNHRRTDLEKLAVLLPHWFNHNRDHIKEQEQWLKKAEKEGLAAVADELKEAIDLAKKAARHMEQASFAMKEEKASNEVKTNDTEEPETLSKKGTPARNTLNPTNQEPIDD